MPRYYTIAEKNMIRKLYKLGKTDSEIAKAVATLGHRTPSATIIGQHRSRMGLVPFTRTRPKSGAHFVRPKAKVTNRTGDLWDAKDKTVCSVTIETPRSTVTQQVDQGVALKVMGLVLGL